MIKEERLQSRLDEAEARIEHIVNDSQAAVVVPSATGLPTPDPITQRARREWAVRHVRAIWNAAMAFVDGESTHYELSCGELNAWATWLMDDCDGPSPGMWVPDPSEQTRQQAVFARILQDLLQEAKRSAAVECP